jgi:hypothetical protein
MPLKILNEDDYRGSAPGAVITDGALAHTHVALLDIEPGKKPARCYVKLYPGMIGEREHRGIVNEMVGHVLAIAMGAPVPANAGLITLSGFQLSDRPEWVEDDSEVVGWWVQDAVAPSLKGYYDINESNAHPVFMAKLEKIRAELLASDQINQIIAFDDLIANIDRNIGNLLRLKASDYLMIDHGLCLASDSWVADELDPEGKFVNKLNAILDPASLYLPFRHATVSAHEKLAANIEPAIASIQKWLAYAVEDRDSAAIERFIRHRANPGGITKRMELFI